MKRIITVPLILLFLTTIANTQEVSSKIFDQVNQFLKQHVYDGLVDYQAIKKSPESLQKLVSTLEKFNLDSLPDANAEKAFWINAYNILVIYSVVSHYPIQSPMDVKGFFDTQEHQVAGEKLTLNDIENIKLRKKFGDPRFHFVLVCAAESCPPIINQAYIGNKLDEQLDARTKANLNDDQFIRVDSAERKVYVSEIFKWYKEDFLGNGKTILQYINQYRRNKVPEDFSVDFYSYDWRLNGYIRGS